MSDARAKENHRRETEAPDPGGSRRISHAISFATVTKPKDGSFFPPLKLAPRQIGTKDGCPVVTFTPAEVQEGRTRLQHSLIAKFSGGRPKIEEVRKAFESAWALAGCATVGALDARHVLIVLKSEDDTKRVLAHPLRRVDSYLFRLFIWSEQFNTKRESSIITTWVKLPGLPTELYDQSFVATILSSVGKFVAVDERTKSLSNPSFARACIEVDVSKPVPGKIWVGVGEKGYWQYLEFENKLWFCPVCKLHGHQLSSCRKSAAAKSTGAIPASIKVNPDPKILADSAKITEQPPIQIQNSSPPNLAETLKGSAENMPKSREQDEEGWQIKTRRRKSSKNLAKPQWTKKPTIIHHKSLSDSNINVLIL